MFRRCLLSCLLLWQTAVAAAEPWQERPLTDHARAVLQADQAATKRGQLSQIAVLATAHLSALPADFDQQRLTPLLQKLQAFAPDKIAIESLSGPQCDYLRDYAFLYPDTADQYCYDPAPARKALNITGVQASAALEKILATAQANRPAAERRRLSALMMAAGDPVSALVQWLRLPPAEQKAADGLTPELVSALEKRRLSRNENVSIGAALAVRLGHERVYPVDDHTGDRATGVIDEKVFGTEMAKVWNNAAATQRKNSFEQRLQQISSESSASLLDWYRELNAPLESELAVAGDFGAAAGDTQSGQSGRKYLAYWETRNMRMVANIREITGAHSKVLAIVGSAHKAYYERYLGVSSDVELVDTSRLLQ
jgi:hypothetical protein